MKKIDFKVTAGTIHAYELSNNHNIVIKKDNEIVGFAHKHHDNITVVTNEWSWSHKCLFSLKDAVISHHGYCEFYVLD